MNLARLVLIGEQILSIRAQNLVCQQVGFAIVDRSALPGCIPKAGCPICGRGKDMCPIRAIDCAKNGSPVTFNKREE